MINKVNYKDEPSLFNNIAEFSIDSDMDLRRGSSFYREDIIEFKKEHAKYFPEIENFEKYLGTWKTNNVIWSDDYGFEDEFSKLIRVKKVETVTYKWEEVTNDK